MPAPLAADKRYTAVLLLMPWKDVPPMMIYVNTKEAASAVLSRVGGKGLPVYIPRKEIKADDEYKENGGDLNMCKLNRPPETLLGGRRRRMVWMVLTSIERTKKHE